MGSKDLEKELPKKEVSIEIGGNRYQVKFPKNRDFLKIENEKNRLSNSDYSSLVYRADNSGFLAKLIIDTISTFSVLIPNLEKDLNIKSYLDLDLIQQNLLTTTYLEQYLPWYQSWIELLSNPSKLKTENEGGNSSME